MPLQISPRSPRSAPYLRFDVRVYYSAAATPRFTSPPPCLYYATFEDATYAPPQSRLPPPLISLSAPREARTSSAQRKEAWNMFFC